MADKSKSFPKWKVSRGSQQIAQFFCLEDAVDYLAHIRPGFLRFGSTAQILWHEGGEAIAAAENVRRVVEVVRQRMEGN